MRAGARGYYLKDSEPSEFLQAIEKASRGEIVMDASVVERILNEFCQSVAPFPAREAIPSLDDRQIDLRRKVACGHSNQEIGRALSPAEKTIKNQLSDIFRELHLANRTQGVIYALRHGLIQLEDMEV